MRPAIAISSTIQLARNLPANRSADVLVGLARKVTGNIAFADDRPPADFSPKADRRPALRHSSEDLINRTIGKLDSEKKESELTTV